MNMVSPIVGPFPTTSKQAMEGIVRWNGTYYLQQTCSLQIGSTLEYRQIPNKIASRGFFFSHEVGGSSTIDYRT